MQDVKNPLHAFWPKVHKGNVPNAPRPVNGAAEIRLIHHGLAFSSHMWLRELEKQRLGFSASAGIAGHRYHTAPIQVRTPNTDILLGVPTQGQCKKGWYPLNSSFVDQSCVLLSVFSLVYLRLQDEFQMSDSHHLSSFKGDFPAFQDSNWDL